MQASILTTFVIVVLSTVAFLLSQSVVEDVISMADVSLADGERTVGPGLVVLGNSLTIVGALLIAFAAATGYLLARQVTDPLRDLAWKVGSLRPGRWQVERTVHTADEVEVLDHALVDMAKRLATVYAHQEEEIAGRTADLRRQYERDRAILGSIHYGVLALNEKGTVIQSNPAAVDILGDTPDGKMIEDALRLRVHGGSSPKEENPARECLRTGTAYRAGPSVHWSIERANQDIMPVTLSVAPLSDAESVFGAIVVFQDVTEERHLDYLKSEFITLASHQLRTPLSAIRWYTELLGDSGENFDEEQKSYVEEIDHSVRRMVALLGSLLHAARMEGDKLEPEWQTVNLSELVKDAVDDARDLFETASIRHVLEMSDVELPVWTDPVLLRVVLQNLLSNAAKYSSKGSSVIVRVVHDGDRAVLTVADTGIGIPKSDQKRIFEKFFRAQNVRRLDTDGNGLGLAISKSIVERLGGSIGFESAENKGTTFRVELELGKESHNQSA